MAEPHLGSSSSGRLTVANGFGWLFAVAGLAVGGKIIADNSLLTHLATGDLISVRGAVPDVDPYSKDYAGLTWTVQSWLASLIYSTGVRIGGESTLRLIHGVLGALVMAGVWRLTESARQMVTRAALTVIPLLIGGTFWSPRPLMFGLVGIVVLLLALRGAIQPWALIPTMYLWVNTHGSFPLAFVLLGGAAVGAIIDHRRLPLTQLRLVAWAGAGLLLAGLNPLGPRLWWFPVMLLRRGDALDQVVEWSAPGFDQPVDFIYLSLLPVIVVAARRGMPWADLVPAIGFFVTGLMAIRNMAPASLVVVTMVAPAMPSLIGNSDGAEAGRAGRMLSIAGITGAVVSVFVVLTSPGLSLDRYPVAAVSYLDDRELMGRDDVAVVHREGVGNYLTYRYGPDANVFFDDRFDFYPIERTEDHTTLVHGGDYRDVLDRHNADVVVWERESDLADWLDGEPEWNLAFTDDEWIVACRVTGPVSRSC